MKLKFPSKIKKALREVVLIFIGITIAIWFENWNNNRISAQREIEILNELHQDLEFSIRELKIKNYRDSLSIASGQIIYNALASANQQYPDSLDKHFAQFYIWRVTGLKKAAFETMKSIGIDIIRNDSLRTSIIDIYDRDLDFINWCFEWERTEFFTNISPLLDKHIQIKSIMKSARPINYLDLKRNTIFVNTLNNYLVNKRFRIDLIKTRAQRIEQLDRNVLAELDRLN